MKVDVVSYSDVDKAQAGLVDAFSWFSSPQGHEFWYAVHAFLTDLKEYEGTVGKASRYLDDTILKTAEAIKARRAAEAAEKTKALYASAAATVTPEKIQRVHEALERARDRGVDLGHDLRVTVGELVGVPDPRYISWAAE